MPELTPRTGPTTHSPSSECHVLHSLGIMVSRRDLRCWGREQQHGRCDAAGRESACRQHPSHRQHVPDAPSHTQVFCSVPDKVL